ncbi:MBL fold metallo-hydrolase [Undibacterium squillarum]|uniref:MBL fold metallo-hydrolase n=1 Tax=Undibacterium squillarum TaxID=1131567 RepID=UPI0035B405D6
MNAQILSFFDPVTGTGTHLVFDQPGGRAAVIDPVLDYDPKSGRTRHQNADKVLTALREHQLTLDWIMETHAHADHLSAAVYLQQQAGGKTVIGAGIAGVQQVFRKAFDLEADFVCDGSQFDHLLHDGETLPLGALHFTAIAVPGHTPADMAYQIGDAVFVGDTMFMPDVGTARCDFPGGDARALYQSVRKLLALPAATRLFLCHDYPPAGSGRSPCLVTTVADQRAGNIHVHDGVSEEDFVVMRSQRDATLEMPQLILPSVQVNIRAGHFPPAAENGVHYLKIPLNFF